MGGMDPVELCDDRLVLRLPRPADVDAVTRACQDRELQRWVPVPVPYESVHAQQWVADTERCWQADEELRWVVTDRDTDQVMAAVGLHPRDESMREIGYWTAPWARGSGVMTAAARLACAWGFDQLGLGRIEWWSNVGNVASRRVAEKLGFRFEGTVRARLLHRGVRVDGWGAGLLPGELR